MASPTYGEKLTVAFSKYIAEYEAGTGKSVTGVMIEALAANYAMAAAKDVTGSIIENGKKLDRKTTRPIEFTVSKHRIDAAWRKMTSRIETTPFPKFKSDLVHLLHELSTPSEAEVIHAEVVGDQKMIERTTSEFRDILSFLKTNISKNEESFKM